jgi:hypothetical protein
MDLEVLRTLGVVPQTFETAELRNWSITFSPMATLVRRVPAQCYISKPGTGQKPSVEYLQRVVKAAEGLDFPPAYLARLTRTPTRG